MNIERLIVGALETNCYVVSDSNGTAAVIDPGGSIEMIEDYIAGKKLDLSAILLTHGHPDHLFSAGKLQQIFDVDIYMHPSDTDQITGGLEIAALFYDMKEYVPAKITRDLGDGDLVSVGDIELQVIHTPGHTPGGVCFLDGSVLFSGDTLFAQSIGRTDLPGGDHSQLMESIKNRLLVLPDNTIVYPGHGGETSIGTEKQFNPFLF